MPRGQKQPIVDGRKQCTKCGEWLSVDAYRVMRRGTRLSAQCFSCERSAKDASRRKNYVYTDPAKNKARNVAITQAEEMEFRNVNDKICARCFQTFPLSEFEPHFRNHHGRLTPQSCCHACRESLEANRVKRDKYEARGRNTYNRDTVMPFWMEDKGCNYNPACLECTLPACVFDLTQRQFHSFQRWWNHHLFLAAVGRMQAEGKSVAEMAEELGLTTRTVQRKMLIPLVPVEEAMGVQFDPPTVSMV